MKVNIRLIWFTPIKVDNIKIKVSRLLLTIVDVKITSAISVNFTKYIQISATKMEVGTK